MEPFYAEAARPTYMPDVRPVVLAGIASGCLFCQAREFVWPNPGDRLQFLTQWKAGMSGTVCPRDKWWRPGGFCIHIDGEPLDRSSHISPGHDLYALKPIDDPPGWFPPFSIDDLAFLDETVVRLCAGLSRNGRWHLHDDELYMPITALRGRRLPVSDEELWAICAAHGMPQRFRKRFVRLYDFGLKLLVHNNGRPPIKRKRLDAPMLIPRYQPKTRNP